MNHVFRLTPDSASTFAAPVDGVILFIFLVALFFTVVIAGLIIFFSIKYRRRPTRQPGSGLVDAAGTVAKTLPGLQGAAVPPSHTPHAPNEHSNVGLILEIAWTAIPLLLTVVMFWAGARTFIRQSQPPPNAMDIDVIGKQWMWKIEHPSGAREINELHVPMGRPVKLRMISQDVIHNFGMPDFRIKQDVMPGRYTSLWFEAIKVGEYNLFCDQYCGTQHSGMIGKIVVMEEKDYQDWLSGHKSNVNPREAGRELFAKYGCVTCHASLAPSLAGVFGRKVRYIDESGKDGETVADEAYLRESILYPAAKIVSGYQPLMPSFRGQLTEEEVNQLIAYMKSLSGATTGPVDYDPAGPGTPTTQPERAVPGPGPFLQGGQAQPNPGQ